MFEAELIGLQHAVTPKATALFLCCLWTMQGSMQAWQCLLPSLQEHYYNVDYTRQAGHTRRPLCSSVSTASSLACSRGCSMGSMPCRTPLYMVHSASRLLICARSVSDRSCSCNRAAHQKRLCQRGALTVMQSWPPPICSFWDAFAVYQEPSCRSVGANSTLRPTGGMSMVGLRMLRK